MTRVRILVRNKQGVFDPEGKVVHGGLGRLGFDEVVGVDVGKVIELELDEADAERVAARVEQMCRKLLANPVIEDYSFEIVEGT